jgi:signal transduction histidine kinase
MAAMPERTSSRRPPSLRLRLSAVANARADDSALREAPADSATSDELLDAVIRTQENERHRIARELHDEVGQALTGVKLDLAALQRRLGRDVDLAGSIAVIDAAIAEIRRIAFDLRPALLDDLGLAPALRWLLVHRCESVGLATRFIGSQLPTLDPILETVCFRIAQEALTNVARHADASTVTVTLGARGGLLYLAIQDDGRGFDVRRIARQPLGDRLGLVGMRERARLLGGDIEIRSSADVGTVIRARLPLRTLPRWAHTNAIAE